MKVFFKQFLVLIGLSFNLVWAETGSSVDPQQTANAKWILDYMSHKPKFPYSDILNHWYGTLLESPEAYEKVIATFTERYKDQKIDAIVGLETRGFVFGLSLAHHLKVPCVLASRPGKLKGEIVSTVYPKANYRLENLELEKSALKKGDKVVIINDFFTTGELTKAACDLVHHLDAQVVEIGCVLELPQFKGREKVGCPVYSLLTIDENID